MPHYQIEPETCFCPKQGPRHRFGPSECTQCPWVRFRVGQWLYAVSLGLTNEQNQTSIIVGDHGFRPSGIQPSKLNARATTTEAGGYLNTGGMTILWPCSDPACRPSETVPPSFGPPLSPLAMPLLSTVLLRLSPSDDRKVGAGQDVSNVLYCIVLYCRM